MVIFRQHIFFCCFIALQQMNSHRNKIRMLLEVYMRIQWCH